jgi:hypothetical protein
MVTDADADLRAFGDAADWSAVGAAAGNSD